MDSLYREFIIDLYNNPLHKGLLEPCDVKHTEHNSSCGDEITIMIQYDADDRIKAVKHDGHGCAISQAAVSLLCDEIIGKTTSDIQALTEEDIYELIQIPISYTRRNCALLGLKAVQKANQKNKKQETSNI